MSCSLSLLGTTDLGKTQADPRGAQGYRRRLRRRPRGHDVGAQALGGCCGREFRGVQVP